MEECKEEIGIEQSREHMGLNRGFLAVSGKEIFMDSKGKFTQGIHRLVGIFAEKMAVILRKSNIQKPVHRLDFPMLTNKCRQLFGRGVPAGNIIAGLPAVMSTNIHNPLNRENRLQSRPSVLFQPGNVLDFAANSFLNPSRIFLRRLAAFPFLLVALILEKQADVL